MKALIIDDERLAREELHRLLERHADIRIVGEAGTASQALKLIAETAPDLLFLDIEMPGRNGFALLEELDPPHPKVIFCTAYDEFALRAFEVNALDYLLKPIDATRLDQAIERVRKSLPSDRAILRDQRSLASPGQISEEDQVFVREGERCWFVPVRSIRLIVAEGNHCRIHFGSEKPLLCRGLGALEERLPPKLFLRANRSQIINLSCVKSIGRWFSNSLKATLSDGTEVELSRRQAQLLKDRMGL